MGSCIMSQPIASNSKHLFIPMTKRKAKRKHIEHEPRIPQILCSFDFNLRSFFGEWRKRWLGCGGGGSHVSFCVVRKGLCWWSTEGKRECFFIWDVTGLWKQAHWYSLLLPSIKLAFSWQELYVELTGFFPRGLKRERGFIGMEARFTWIIPLQ